MFSHMTESPWSCICTLNTHVSMLNMIAMLTGLAGIMFLFSFCTKQHIVIPSVQLLQFSFSGQVDTCTVSSKETYTYEYVGLEQATVW